MSQGTTGCMQRWGLGEGFGEGAVGKDNLPWALRFWHILTRHTKNTKFMAISQGSFCSEQPQEMRY